MARTLYQKFRDIWKDKPDKTTPVTAEALNHIEQGIYDNSDRMALKEIYGDRAINLGRKEETTIGDHSTSEGVNTEASGRAAHAEGNNTIASNSSAHAEGEYTEANALYSHAEGYHTRAVGQFQHVQGKYNELNLNHAFQIGNGSSDEARSNACYVDWEGNAWFAGDVSNGMYSLNDLGNRIGDEDISSQCYVNTNGQTAEITIPIDGIVTNSSCIAGGFFLGAINLGGMPPMLLNADISITRYLNNSTEIEGTAELINTFASTTPQFSSAFYGSIEVVSLAQDSATTCKGTAKMVFDLGMAVTVSNFTIYKSSKYYYPIAHLVNGLTERIEALEQRIAELENKKEE